MRTLRPLALLCALAHTACNDHRYGFFGDSEGGSGSGSETLGTTTFAPTTVTPTTLTTLPTTATTSTSDPTTVTSIPPTVSSDPVTTVTTVGPGCGEIQLPASVPVQGFDSLDGKTDFFGLSCGVPGGTDVSFVWTAPFAGRFSFDTAGSSFDTLLGVFDGACFGPELACDDDSGGDLSSRVELDLFGGQTVTAVVDSFGQNFGEAVLNINEVMIDNQCPDGDFGPVVPVEIPGQTAGAPNVRTGSCGGESSPEIEAAWMAPFDGTFFFQVTQSDFDPLLYLRLDGCDGPELACSDDFDGLNPFIQISLSAGQRVVVIVDGAGGGAGNFTLQIGAL